jgi:hypothetical protein
VKRLLAVLIASGVAVPAFGTDVSASIGISQPGFYGQINIGEFPRPAVIYAQPVWVQRPPKVVQLQPIYLRVPPGHEKHWSKHCGKYGACGQPVYFVREDWYQTKYVPYYQQHDYYARGKSGDHDSEHGHGKGKGHGHEGGED